MSDNLIENLIELLKSSNLTTYEINVFITLLKSKTLTARKISNESKVPTGRIYEVLDELKNKGMIEILESRPKKFRSLSLNKALNNLLNHQTDENKRKTSYLYHQAKILESNLYESDTFIKKEPSRLFWSTTFGSQSILSLYTMLFNEVQSELLMINFINKNTIKVLPYGKNFFEGIRRAVEKGARVKFLWSFGYDDRPLSDEQKIKNSEIFEQINEKLLDLYSLSTRIQVFEMKFIHKRIPSYYDIFDKKRILFKLQNPLKPWQIFACMNVLDPTLAKDLREKFYNVWTFEANDSGAQ
ncbi:MAG: TrmB family transcriptional regulator [Promethearchaeota archaeon]